MTTEPEKAGVARRAMDWVRTQDASAVRNALSLTLPLAIGTAMGEPGQGALGAIGAFTAMYAHNRPYPQRTRRWFAVTVLLLGAFVAGSLVAASTWAGVVTIGVVGAVLTYAMKILSIGPPGGYMLVLACATGTHLPPDLGQLGPRCLVVALGALGALLVCSAGRLTAPDAPERRFLAIALRAVANALTPGDEPVGRTAAHRALHDAGVAIAVGSRRTDRARLAAAVTELRRLVDGPPLTAAGAAALASAAEAVQGTWPLRHPDRVNRESLESDPVLRPLALILDATPGSSPAPLAIPSPLSTWRTRTPRALRSGLRAGVAATAAGAVAVALQVDRPYWGAAAAVAVLANDGSRATAKRAWNRFAGTVAGVLLAAGIIALGPGPITIVIAVAVLQLFIQSVVGRSYGLAVVAITPLALLIADAATGQLTTADLWPRLLETAIGCLLALAARLLIFPNAAAYQLPMVMASVRRRTETWLAGTDLPAEQQEADRVALERVLLALEDAVGAARDEFLPSPHTLRDIDLAGDLLERTWPLAVHRPGRHQG